MKYLNNMLWMLGGVGAGMMIQSKSKDIKKMMKKGQKQVEKIANNVNAQIKNN